MALKLHWDETVLALVKQKCKRWKLDISNILVQIPRSIPTKLKSVTVVGIHIFREASIPGCCAATYRVVHQPSSITQNLIACKSKLSKYEITIPRLEIISTHLSANMGTNITKALKNFNVRSATCWTDSTVILH